MKQSKLAAITLAISITPFVTYAVDTWPLPKPGDFNIPVDGDEMNFTVSDGKPGHLEFCLSTAKAVTWWKGIKVFGNRTWTAKALLVTQDADHGPTCAVLNVNELDEDFSRLEFWKAKFKGIHTDMVHYRFSPKSYNGKKLSFTWETD